MREPERVEAPEPVKPTTGLSPYAEAALDSACRRIISKPVGEQESELNGESFSIGTLAGGIAHDFNNVLAAILGNAALAQARAVPRGGEGRPRPGSGAGGRPLSSAAQRSR